MSKPSLSRPALQELPLEQFLVPPNPSLMITPSKRRSRSNKRPRSPRAPSSCSPVKQRILCEESLTSPTLRSPLWAKSGRFSPSRFQQLLLQGPDSPVKKLDFGRGEEILERVFQTGMTISVLSRRSPRTTPLRSAMTKARTSAQKSLMRSPAHHTPKPSPDAKLIDCFSSPFPKVVSPPLPPLAVPRKIPQLDRDPVHYPGFDMYIDPYDYIPKPVTTTVMGDSDTEFGTLKSKKEEDKENIPPRKRASKLLFGEKSDADGLFSNNVKSGKSTPLHATPRSKKIREIPRSTTQAMSFSLPSRAYEPDA